MVEKELFLTRRENTQHALRDNRRNLRSRLTTFKMRKTLLIALAFMPLVLAAQRLEVIGAAGQTLSRGGVSVTATLGEVFVATPSGPEQFATEGFQQGYLLANVAVSRTETTSALTTAELYPNPAVERVQVSFENPGGQPVQLKLYNSVGSLLETVKTGSSTHDFKVAALPAGHYWISIQPTDYQPAISLPFEKVNH